MAEIFVWTGKTVNLVKSVFKDLGIGAEQLQPTKCGRELMFVWVMVLTLKDVQIAVHTTGKYVPGCACYILSL